MNDQCGYLGKGGTFCGLLMRSSQSIESRIESKLAAVGLSLAKLGVLEHLTKEGQPLPLSRLAERLACVKSNITQLIDRLESDGLVERIYDSEDRRSVLAAITKEGTLKRKAGNRVLATEERNLIQKFKEVELERLSEMLGRVE